MKDKPLSPRWLVQGMVLIAIIGFTIPIITGVASYLKQEISQPLRNENQGQSEAIKRFNQVSYL